MEKVAQGASKLSTARYVSPLRYPGGKGKVANYLKLLIVRNSLVGARYVEPYAGGASVALSLLLEGYISHAYINDLNKGVYAFWRYALESPDSFCGRINEVPLSISEWRRQKAVYSDPDSSMEDLGFATFFLNRTNRSGIISRGGVIGGTEQLGKWKMDARFDRKTLCQRIRMVADLKPKITLTQSDALSLLEDNREHDAKSVFYLDPPYYVKGSGLYDNFYGHGDHASVCEKVMSLKGSWVVSYDAAPQILEMYKSSKSIRYTLGYSASGAAQGREVMFFSPDLVLPDIESPAGVSIKTVEKERFRGAETC
jgi:DNA adenine methylase